MGDDLRHFRPAYLKLQQDVEHMSRVLGSSYSGIFDEMERILEPIRRQHVEISRFIELSRPAFPLLTEIVRANQHWQGLLDQAAASARVSESLSRTHQTWLDLIRPMQDSIAQIEAVAKMSLGDITYRTTVAERLLAGIDFKAMRQAMALPELAFPKLESVVGDAMSTYRQFAASIRTLPDLMRLPAFALPGATREVLVTGHVLDSIRIPGAPDKGIDASEAQAIDEVRQETSGCIGLLRSVDPALARMYVGAGDALGGRNPDRARHILSSLRELWDHLLRRIAPDERVLLWVPKNNADLLHQGRPTRRARVLYVCRTLNHEPLSEFVDQDSRALVKLVEFFNRMHELDPGLTDDQLRVLLLRTESWLTYILQISELGPGACD